MMTLYDHPLSPYGQKVKIALREKGVAFETLSPGGLGAGGAGGAFAQANRRAEVPTLIDGDVAVFDSTVILEYLEDCHPTPPLLPRSPVDRAWVRMIEEGMDMHFEPINWGLSERRWFKRAEGEKPAVPGSAAARQLSGFFAWLERQLGKRTWFNGEAFGWGDLAVVPFLNGSAGQGHRPVEGARLAAWLAGAKAEALYILPVGAGVVAL
jgi:glutathione S-transferase